MASTKPPYPTPATESAFQHFTKGHKILKHQIQLFNGSVNIIVDAIERGEGMKIHAQHVIAENILANIKSYVNSAEAALYELADAAKNEVGLFDEDEEEQSKPKAKRKRKAA